MFTCLNCCRWEPRLRASKNFSAQGWTALLPAPLHLWPDLWPAEVFFPSADLCTKQLAKSIWSRGVCVGVDCVLKYLGTRNWYNHTSGLCEPSTLCSANEASLIQIHHFSIVITSVVFLYINRHCLGQTYDGLTNYCHPPPEPPPFNDTVEYTPYYQSNKPPNDYGCVLGRSFHLIVVGHVKAKTFRVFQPILTSQFS